MYATKLSKRSVALDLFACVGFTMCPPCAVAVCYISHNSMFSIVVSQVASITMYRSQRPERLMEILTPNGNVAPSSQQQTPFPTLKQDAKLSGQKR